MLRDNASRGASINETFLNALNCVTNYSHEPRPEDFGPYTRYEELNPGTELYLQVLFAALPLVDCPSCELCLSPSPACAVPRCQVKTELVLGGLRGAGDAEVVADSRLLLDKYFPVQRDKHNYNMAEEHRCVAAQHLRPFAVCVACVDGEVLCLCQAQGAGGGA